MDAETQIHYRELGLSSETIRALMYLEGIEQDDGNLSLTEIDLQAGIYTLIVDLDRLRVLIGDWSRTLETWLAGQSQDGELVDLLSDMYGVIQPKEA